MNNTIYNRRNELIDQKEEEITASKDKIDIHSQSQLKMKHKPLSIASSNSSNASHASSTYSSSISTPTTLNIPTMAGMKSNKNTYTHYHNPVFTESDLRTMDVATLKGLVGELANESEVLRLRLASAHQTIRHLQTKQICSQMCGRNTNINTNTNTNAPISLSTAENQNLSLNQKPEVSFSPAVNLNLNTKDLPFSPISPLEKTPCLSESLDIRRKERLEVYVSTHPRTLTPEDRESMFRACRRGDFALAIEKEKKGYNIVTEVDGRERRLYTSNQETEMDKNTTNVSTSNTSTTSTSNTGTTSINTSTSTDTSTTRETDSTHSQSEINGPTVLHYATWYTSSTVLPFILALLHNGADPNAIDENGNTPLMNVCSYMANIENMRMLLNYGARVEMVNNRHISALELLLKNECASKEAIDLLLSHGA